MKKYLVIVLVLLCFPLIVNAQRGCCSHHNGVCGCTSSGRTKCCDGTTSPSCTCTPPSVYGCTDPNANNYNSNANKNNGTCKYDVYGCTDKNAKNYNIKANKNDGSCIYEVLGCTNYKSSNYNKDATKDDGSCDYNKGCTDLKAINYDENAFVDDGTCIYEKINDEIDDNSLDDDNNIINNNSLDDNFDQIMIDGKATKEEIINEVKKDKVDDVKKTNSDSTDLPDTLIPLTLLGGGGYYAYTKIKGKKK